MTVQERSTLSQAGATVSKNISNPCIHWKSTYKEQVSPSIQSPARSISVRPHWTIPREAYSSVRAIYNTEFGDNFGTSPRKILNSESTKHHIKHDSTTLGTTKLTAHPPGYTGFIPVMDMQENATSQAYCESPRRQDYKNNLINNYNTKLVGYKGHKPSAAINEKGNLREYCFSTEQESFK